MMPFSISPQNPKPMLNLPPGLDHVTESILLTTSKKEAEPEKSLPRIRYPDIHHSVSTNIPPVGRMTQLDT